MDREPSPSTLLTKGVKLVKSFIQCVNADVAPVSRTIAKELVSKAIVLLEFSEVKAQKNAVLLCIALYANS